jgi:GTP-binding protein
MPKALKFLKKLFENVLAPFVDFPIIFTSATTKQRIFKVIDTATEVFQNKRKKNRLHELNEYLLPSIKGIHLLLLKENILK